MQQWFGRVLHWLAIERKGDMARVQIRGCSSKDVTLQVFLHILSGLSKQSKFKAGTPSSAPSKVTQGKVRHVGLSNETPYGLTRAILAA
eukprot:scaffold220988_cov17-Tisochrysis_lutea.AAC.1